MIRELRYILAVLVGVSMMFSCADEPLVSGYGDIPEGHATVSAKVSFKSFGSALNGDSRTAGDAIKEIQSLYVVLFDANGKWIETFDATDQEDYKEDLELRNDVQAGTGGHIAEEKTPCATFKKTLPYGKYKIYVVANHTSELNEKYTIDDLRSINLTWDTSMGKNKNNQMFGYFTNGKNTSKLNGWEAPEVTIASPTVDLHAWIRRAASKVTVAYDGSRLNENVYITLKSVQIKDIPNKCTLGRDYGAGSEDDLINEGEKITYAKDNDGPVITRGGVNWGSLHIEGWNDDKPYDPTDLEGEAHTETSEALFFYENMQGTGEAGTSTDKSLNRLDYKEKGKKFGTYIEVKAHYENKNEGDVSSGEITYRFMLGKNESIDYNAERNYHYKLTLCFNRDANDVDWRIVYKEEPGIYVPNPYYISYLYNESMNLPLKVVIDKDDEITELKAEIVENNWERDNNDSQNKNENDTYYGNKFDTYKSRNSTNEITENINGENDVIHWLGFLSLRDEYDLVGKLYLGPAQNTDFGYTDYKQSSAPYKHWIDRELGTRNDYESSRTEEMTGTSTKSVIYSIPLYTRVKQLYIVSGFVGNNPYVGYNRTARVKFTVTTKSGKRYDPVTVKIIQVKRLVNPTGIWRNKNNADHFNVVLKEQSGYGGNFEDLISDGPWSVKKINGDWFEVSETEGPTGSRVAFKYTPKDKTDTPRCGIIEVKYHNNTCTHLIFVRQGYEPIAIEEGEANWYSFNMKTSNEMTTSPLDEGSLYRWGKWNYPIAESNNVDSKFSYGVNPGTNGFTIEGVTNKVNWTTIGSQSRNADFSPQIEGTKIPTLKDWEVLRDKHKQGYGVLYGDDATEVAVTTNDAYGYRSANGEGKRGMRGVFAYNKTTGANIFFPIGAVGYGHRKQQYSGGKPGVLRYSTTNELLEAEYRPLLYDLMYQYGAIYWTSTEGNGWDINFNQLDFNVYNYANAWSGSTNSDYSDACFVRLVEE